MGRSAATARLMKGVNVALMTAQRRISDRATSATVTNARGRAARMSDNDLTTWAENVEMDIGKSLSIYRQTGDVLALQEALVLTDSLSGLLGEMIERHLRS